MRGYGEHRRGSTKRGGRNERSGSRKEKTTVLAEVAIHEDQTDFVWTVDSDKALSLRAFSEELTFACGVRRSPRIRLSSIHWQAPTRKEKSQRADERKPLGHQSLPHYSPKTSLSFFSKESEDSAVLSAQIFSSFLLLLRRVREYTFIFEFRRICHSTCLLNHFSTRLCALSLTVSQEPFLPCGARRTG